MVMWPFYASFIRRTIHLAWAGRKERPEEGVAAVARKLAVLLHRLWATKQPYVLSMKLKPLAVAAGSDLAIT